MLSVDAENIGVLSLYFCDYTPAHIPVTSAGYQALYSFIVGMPNVMKSGCARQVIFPDNLISEDFSNEIQAKKQ